MRDGRSLSDERMDSTFILSETDWKQPPTKGVGIVRKGRKLLGLVRTKAATQRAVARTKGTKAAKEMLRRLGL
jgi:hypothetical protein